jgi:hypothetical protein
MTGRDPALAGHKRHPVQRGGERRPRQGGHGRPGHSTPAAATQAVTGTASESDPAEGTRPLPNRR